jgi:hypothetical protein
MKNKMAWILGGGATVGLVMIAASLGACSSGDSTTKDAGKDVTTADTGKQDTGTQDTGTPDTGIQDAGADCKNVPSSFPFTTDSGAYCPFQQAADGGTMFGPCNVGDHCCVYPVSSNLPSTCNGGNTACSIATDAGTADFGCNETNDCPSNQVCCLTAPGYLSQDPGCMSYYFVGKNAGTSCAASCGTQPQLCGSDSDCPQGKTCKPVNTKGMWLGACQ